MIRKITLFRILPAELKGLSRDHDGAAAKLVVDPKENKKSFGDFVCGNAITRKLFIYSE